MANQSTTPFDQGLFLVHLNRGREHFDARNFTDAAEEFEEARRLRPGDDSVLNLLGLAYFKQEKFKEADSVYRKLIELNPESSTLYFNLGLVCFKLGDLDRAEATFLRALELKSDNQKTHFYLGNIYEKKQQYYNAIFQYRKAGANIMVKRVQEKIDRERPPEQGTDEDFAVPAPALSDDTKPTLSRGTEAEKTSPDLQLDRVNVDVLDRRRILSAIQQGVALPSPARLVPPPSGDEETPLEQLVEEAVTETETETDTETDTEETLPMAGDGSAIRKQARARRGSVPIDPAVSPAARPTTSPTTGEETMPPPPPREPSDTATTRLRLSEPLVQDESLAEMARSRVPGNPSADLFFSATSRGGPPEIPPAESLGAPENRSGAGGRQSVVQKLNWGAAPASGEPHVYARGRRREDLFRYLENNLMEVNFSGKVFIKQGTIYSYSGNLTFWVKPPRQDAAPPLVIVSGTGKLLLTDRQRDITVLQIEDEEIFVEPSHLLACQETLTPRYAVIETAGGGKHSFHVLMIRGTGMLALSVATNPLVLTVQQEYPVNVSTSSIISWSGELTPTIVEDEALAELMLPGTSPGFNLRLEGEGRVMMEKLAR